MPKRGGPQRQWNLGGEHANLEDGRGWQQQLRGVWEVGQLPTEGRSDPLGVLVQAVGRSGDVGQRQLPGLLQNADLWTAGESG